MCEEERRRRRRLRSRERRCSRGRGGWWEVTFLWCRCVVRVCVCVCVVHKGRCASRARAREQHHTFSASGATLLLLANAHTYHSHSTLRTRAPLRAAPTAPPPPLLLTWYKSDAHLSSTHASCGAAAVLRATPCFFLRVKQARLVACCPPEEQLAVALGRAAPPRTRSAAASGRAPRPRPARRTGAARPATGARAGARSSRACWHERRRRVSATSPRGRFRAPLSRVGTPGRRAGGGGWRGNGARLQLLGLAAPEADLLFERILRLFVRSVPGPGPVSPRWEPRAPPRRGALQLVGEGAPACFDQLGVLGDVGDLGACAGNIRSITRFLKRFFYVDGKSGHAQPEAPGRCWRGCSRVCGRVDGQAGGGPPMSIQSSMSMRERAVSCSIRT
jgi:hypothetical protein